MFIADPCSCIFFHEIGVGMACYRPPPSKPDGGFPASSFPVSDSPLPNKNTAMTFEQLQSYLPVAFCVEAELSRHAWLT